MQHVRLDAEAAGEAELIEFFREAGVMQARLAERAKAILGIIEQEASPEGSIPPVLNDTRAGEVSPPVQDVSPTTDVSRTLPATALSDEHAESPTVGASADVGIAAQDEDTVAPAEAPRDAPQTAINQITPEDLDPTISVLQGGIPQLAIGRWRR